MITSPPSLSFLYLPFLSKILLPFSLPTPTVNNFMFDSMILSKDSLVLSPKSSPSEIKIITLELISNDWAFSSLSFDKESSRAGPKICSCSWN